jgi:hypothetical protein
VLTGDEDKTLRNFLSDFDNLWNPFVSLIGKMKLSVDYATDVMMYFSGQRHPIWRLPDAPLRYVMLTYEMTGGDRPWLDHVAGIIVKADEALEKAGPDAFDRQKVQTTELDFSWHKNKPAMVYYHLGLQQPDAQECRYHELRG